METTQSHFKCVRVNKNEGAVSCDLMTRSRSELGEGEVTVRITHSSLNYKDALAYTGHPGVAKSLPLVPGIDAAGEVIESTVDRFRPGELVMIFHAKFGTEVDGGYSEVTRVPADWVYAIPSPLTPELAMLIGTAGFTSAQCVDQLIRHGVKPSSGPVVVSGATGGVGIFGIKILAKLGYEVIASTGKVDRKQWLLDQGASEVIDRNQLNDQSDRPLLKGRFAGAIDTVGSNTLGTILRSTKIDGCVTACGLAGGFDLPVTVYPFILRGVNLQGVDTANIPREYRQELWGRLANEWFVEGMEALKEIVTFENLEEKVKLILKGQIAGRTVVRISD